MVDLKRFKALVEASPDFIEQLGTFQVSVRVRKAGGGWSRWAKLHVEPADAPDPGEGGARRTLPRSCDSAMPKCSPSDEYRTVAKTSHVSRKAISGSIFRRFRPERTSIMQC